MIYIIHLGFEAYLQFLFKQTVTNLHGKKNCLFIFCPLLFYLPMNASPRGLQDIPEFLIDITIEYKQLKIILQT